jgi:hypothetical protein
VELPVHAASISSIVGRTSAQPSALHSRNAAIVAATETATWLDGNAAPHAATWSRNPAVNRAIAVWLAALSTAANTCRGPTTGNTT